MAYRQEEERVNESGEHPPVSFNLVILREHKTHLKTIRLPPTHQLYHIIRDSLGLGQGRTKPAEAVGPIICCVKFRKFHVYIMLKSSEECCVLHWLTSGLSVGYFLKERCLARAFELPPLLVGWESH